MFVLRMDRYDAATGFVLAAHPRPQPQYTYPRMLSLESVKFSAVLGGFVDASANSSYEAIHVESSAGEAFELQYKLGLSDGLADGNSVGPNVGFADGIIEGCNDGAWLGAWVGDSLGLSDG